MADQILIESALQRVDNLGTTAQVELLFMTDPPGPILWGSEVRNARNSGIRVADWGEISWSYDMEDALLVPGTCKMKLFDHDLLLCDLLFDTVGFYEAFTKAFQVTIRINNVIEFIGTATEDSIVYDRGEQSLEFTAESDMSIFNKTLLYDTDGMTPTNPFGYQGAATRYPITRILEDVYHLVNPSISHAGGSLVIHQDWLFYGERAAPDFDAHQLTDIVFTQLRQDATPLFLDASYGLGSVGDVLKKLAVDWGCFTGMIHKEKAFFKKLFCYDATNTQSLGTVLNREFAYKYGLIDYVEFTSFPAAITTYSRGVNNHLEGRSIVRDLLPSFVYGFDNPDGGVTGVTNVDAVVVGGSYPGTYDVYKVGDPDIDGGLQVDNGELLAKFWWKFRSNIQRCRADRITVKGVTYDFLKDFTDDGRKYQPIGMTKKIGANTTEFEALYLGRV